ncbi:MAG: FRG domain-containing protein [Candidatus Eisenbacteria bacterium]|nr:FRG domain-containing protein [Candidatus Eisenbacteria bacterium]
MPATRGQLRRRIKARYAKCPIGCPIHSDVEIKALSDFFAVFQSLLTDSSMYWFRGHPRLDFDLAPSALRYKTAEERDRALGLVAEMKRYLEMKLDRPPGANDRLGWMQVAQHYGLPTRLLDWTQNAAVALFFTCSAAPDANGLVVVMNPIELNQQVDPKRPRVLNYELDRTVIEPYMTLNGTKRRGGRPTIAINPTWNTERIALQQGAFTLHGSRHFAIDGRQVASLIGVPILREHKAALLSELERVGIGEMFIYPEPEHVCSHLRRSHKL